MTKGQKERSLINFFHILSLKEKKIPLWSTSWIIDQIKLHLSFYKPLFKDKAVIKCYNDFGHYIHVSKFK